MIYPIKERGKKMKRSSLCKLLSAVSAGVLCLVTAGFSASAVEDKDIEASSNLPVAEKIVLSDLGETVYYVDAPSPFSKTREAQLETRKYNALSAADKTLFDRCKGLRYGYDDLSHYDSQAAGARSLYNGMYDYAMELWGSGSELTYTLEDIDVTDKKTGTTTTKTFKCINMIEPTSYIGGLNAAQVYFTFRHDNPLFYFYGMSVINYTDGSLGILIEDDRYIYADNRASFQKAIKDFLSGSESVVKNDYTCTDYRNALELYKKVTNNMEYARYSNGEASEEPFAHNILGGIVDHKGVCESYAKIYSLLLTYNHIDNIFVTGMAGTEAHAWNLLKFDDGKYYYADSTWDDTNGSSNGDDTSYFAKGTTNFLDKHTLDEPSALYALTHDNIYLYPIPDVPADDFNKNGDYRKTNPRLVDFNRDGSSNNLDIKFLQTQITKGISYSNAFDLNNDKKLNNRDLKELQSALNGFAK